MAKALVVVTWTRKAMVNRGSAKKEQSCHELAPCLPFTVSASRHERLRYDDNGQLCPMLTLKDIAYNAPIWWRERDWIKLKMLVKSYKMCTGAWYYSAASLITRIRVYLGKYAVHSEDMLALTYLILHRITKSQDDAWRVAPELVLYVFLSQRLKLCETRLLIIMEQ